MLDGLKHFHFFGQTFTSNVQPSLDRSDRRGEGVAHFDQALSIQVKRLERFSIERTESSRPVRTCLTRSSASMSPNGSFSTRQEASKASCSMLMGRRRRSVG